MRKASIKETGEEISQADWARFDAAVARAKAERAAVGRPASGYGVAAEPIDRGHLPRGIQAEATDAE